MLELSQTSQHIAIMQIQEMCQNFQRPDLSTEQGHLVHTLLDSLLQLLYSLTLLSEGWRRMAKAGNLNQSDEALAELAQISQQALHELRLLIDELSSEEKE